ncbi:helix-turn-helix domain-containing protein [Streptomyces sp. NPDC001889]
MSDSGKHIKEVRKRRGLTQRGLSAASGVSLSIIRKLEQGERETARMETLRKLATALRVPTMRLAGDAAEEGPGEGTEQRWEAVRAALEQPPATPGSDDEQPTVEGVRTSLAVEALPLYAAHEFSALSKVLGPMLRDAEALGDDGRTTRVRLLQLAGGAMVHTRQFDAAETALLRALNDAGDRLEGAATVNTLCWLRLRQGRLDTAYDLAVKWADEVEPRVSRATPTELSTWGLLLLRVSAAAVRNGQTGQATDALRLARAAAVALGREHTPENENLRSFGPLTVKLKAAENASVAGRPDTVLRLAEGVPPLLLRSVTTSNRNRHMLDVANAYAGTRRFPEAFEKLEEIRGGSPEWLPNQRYARDILGKIIKGRRTLTDEMRTMADVVRLPL